MKALRVVFVAATLAGLAGTASAACNPNGSNGIPGTITIYEGRIGTYPIRLAVIFSADGAIEGRYAYATSTADITLQGKFEKSGDRVSLTELDAKGAPSATFELNCNMGEGQWRAIAGGKPPLDVVLNVTLTSKGPPLDHMYEIAGAKDDEVVNRGAHAFRKAVLADDRAEVARHIAYPIKLYLDKQPVTFAHATELLARYDEIFLPGTRKDIAEAIPRLMFARGEGVMLAEGGFVWLDRNGKVQSINVH